MTPNSNQQKLVRDPITGANVTQLELSLAEKYRQYDAAAAVAKKQYADKVAWSGYQSIAAKTGADLNSVARGFEIYKSQYAAESNRAFPNFSGIAKPEQYFTYTAGNTTNPIQNSAYPAPSAPSASKTPSPSYLAPNHSTVSKRFSALLSSSDYSEGQSITFNLNTTSFAGATVYYSIRGTGKTATNAGITASDFGPRFKGQVRLDSQGKAYGNVYISEDTETEGTETFQIDFFEDSLLKVKLGSTGEAAIRDTSLSKPVYRIETLNNSSSFTEGTGIFWKVLAEPGTQVRWAIEGSNVTRDDFLTGVFNGRQFSSQLSGTIRADSRGFAEFQHMIVNDNGIEGLEKARLVIYEDDSRTRVAVSKEITISDKPLTQQVDFITGRPTVHPEPYRNLFLAGGGSAIGNSLDNYIYGGNEGNWIDGKDGRDVLTGGLGADLFVFSTRPIYGRGTADRITDFNAAEGDSLMLDKSAFGIAGSVKSTVKTVYGPGELQAALGSAETFVYDRGLGELYFNQNGALAGAGNGGVFAILDNKSALGSISFH